MLTRWLFALALCSATTAFGGTTQDVYLKLWAKQGIDLNDSSARLKPKAACVCQDGGGVQTASWASTASRVRAETLGAASPLLQTTAASQRCSFAPTSRSSGSSSLSASTRGQR
jgi:hypothetical protein